MQCLSLNCWDSHLCLAFFLGIRSIASFWLQFASWNKWYSAEIIKWRLINDIQFLKMNIVPLTMDTGSLWEKYILKILLISWIWFLCLRSLRCSQRGIVDLYRSKGCKVTSFQSWRFDKNSASRPELNHLPAALVWVLDDWIILRVWWTITLQLFDQETHITSFERSYSTLLTYCLTKKLRAF